MPGIPLARACISSASGEAVNALHLCVALAELPCRIRLFAPILLHGQAEAPEWLDPRRRLSWHNLEIWNSAPANKGT